MIVKEKIEKFLQRIDLDLRIIFLAVKDPQTSKFTKILGGFFIALALSPIDLIPDFIPVIGLIDDIIIIPLGIIIIKKMIPKRRLVRYREEAMEIRLMKNRKNQKVVFLIWFILLIITTTFIVIKCIK